MKLLSKKDYDFVEYLLRDYFKCTSVSDNYKKSIEEIIDFFNVPIYKEFLELFYFKRNEYSNRYPDNRSMLRYLCDKLYVQEPTLYMVRKEIVHKSAMIFYKNNILE